MKFSPKILLGIICIIISLSLLIIYAKPSQQLKEKQTQLSKLRGDPALDTVENRIQYMQKSAALKAEIKKFEENWMLSWYKFISFALALTGGLLIRRLWNFL